MNTIRIKRIYDPLEQEDGYRILVDRLWSRGVSKEKAHLDGWAKNIAPSTEIRKQFNHKPDLMGEFKMKYLFELDSNESAVEFLQQLREKLKVSNVTLLYAAKDREVNHAVILKEWLEEQL